MSGYTPLYETLLTGTLYGRWPHNGIWACLLSRASREGVIDEVPASLAAAIGVPVELLLDCIKDFMSPDEGSRSSTDEGRRLAPIDPHRGWGWKIINHSKYREKARKKNYDLQRTESGADKERKAADRNNTDVPRCPAMSRDVPLSEAEAEAEAEADKKKNGGRFAPPTLDEIQSFMKDKTSNHTAEAAKFFNHYESNGWKVGKNVMKKWKAAATGWLSRDYSCGQKTVMPSRAREFPA